MHKIAVGGRGQRVSFFFLIQLSKILSVIIPLNHIVWQNHAYLKLSLFSAHYKHSHMIVFRDIIPCACFNNWSKIVDTLVNMLQGYSYLPSVVECIINVSAVIGILGPSLSDAITLVESWWITPLPCSTEISLHLFISQATG